MGQKDKIEKILFDYNDVFADILNVLVFGRHEVEEADLETTGTESVYKAETGDYVSQFRDVAKIYKKENIRFAIIGLENQTGIDGRLPVRVIAYDAAAYRSQYRDKRLVPVITLVLNFSDKRWDDKYKSLKGVLDISEKLEPFVSDYRINVIDVAFLDEGIRRQFKSDFKIIADFFYEKRICGADFTPSDDRIRHVREMLDFLAAFADDEGYRRLGDTLVSDAGKGREITMCTVLQSYLQKGLAQGREEGRAAGREEGRAAERVEAIVCLLKKDVPNDFILSLGYTGEEISEARNALIQQA